MVLCRRLIAVAGALAAGIAAGPQTASAATVWVGPAGCSDARGRLETSASAPLCTLSRAAALAQAGDTVRIGAGTYRGVLRPARSGEPRLPIRFVGEPGAVVDAAGAPAAVHVAGVHDIAVTGLAVTGAAAQGVWVDAAARVRFAGLAVRGNAGHGVQIRDSRAVAVTRSRIAGNAGAGIVEVGSVTEGRYVGDTVVDNGHGGGPYNGDGIQLRGSGALVRGCRILRNGDAGLWEHGIYASAGAAGYVIARTRLAGNGGTNLKLQGSGAVRASSVGSARIGIYVDADAVTVADTTVAGAFGPAAIHVAAAARFELAGSSVTATGGAALVVVPDPAAVATLVADGNGYRSDAPATAFAWGAERLPLAGWRAATGGEAASTLAAG